MTKPIKWMCGQRRLRSADQSLPCPHEESLVPYLPIQRTAKTLIRQAGCPSWYIIWVFAGHTIILLVLSQGGSCDLIWAITIQDKTGNQLNNHIIQSHVILWKIYDFFPCYWKITFPSVSIQQINLPIFSLWFGCRIGTSFSTLSRRITALFEWSILVLENVPKTILITLQSVLHAHSVSIHTKQAFHRLPWSSHEGCWFTSAEHVDDELKIEYF